MSTLKVPGACSVSAAGFVNFDLSAWPAETATAARTTPAAQTVERSLITLLRNFRFAPRSTVCYPIFPFWPHYRSQAKTLPTVGDLDWHLGVESPAVRAGASLLKRRRPVRHDRDARRRGLRDAG